MSNEWYDVTVGVPVKRKKYIDEIEIEYDNDLGTFHAVGLFSKITNDEPVFIEVLTGTVINWDKTVKRWRYYNAD